MAVANSDPGSPQEPVLGCLLHGFGASADDVAPLGSMLDGTMRWIVPQAPYPLQIGGMVHGYAWFPRDEQRRHEALYGKYFLDLPNLEPPDLASAARGVVREIEQTGVPWSRVVLGGFSQGAMVSAEIIRQGLVHDGPLPAGVLLFSGALIARSWWDEVSEPPATDGIPKPPVFISHGTDDSILPISAGMALKDTLNRAGCPITEYIFSGAHEIPAAAVLRAADFISNLSS